MAIFLPFDSKKIYPKSVGAFTGVIKPVRFMSTPKRYEAQKIEDKWYQHWMSNGYFHSEPDDRPAYSIVIPPPNVTGILHMGHMLNNTIQDILIRKARMDGKNACWVPGTDHASIATEAKVVKMLREKGIKKYELTREEFLNYAWEWKEEYGGIILQQLQKLGASCDWQRTAFTMDEDRSRAVIKAFVDLHKKGKIYRGKRMVNWDPKAKTVLSNEEVIYKDEQAHLYYVKYPVVGSDEHIVIATTRPETILGDSAIAVHPKDERYAHLKGKKVIVPLVNRAVPIIFDRYVDMEFGTGALKITPAHDVNDYEIGLQHDLQVIEILNEDGSLSDAAEFYIGTDRFKARKMIVKDLEASDIIEKIEPYTHSVGRSERTNAVIEPRLSMQWYVDMKSIAEPALDAVIKEDIKFYPKHYINTYKHWMENIRDWCISRQLWWGHRIPAYYYKDEIFVGESVEEVLHEIRTHYNDPNIQESDIHQDEDVLDTWFSSWLWPISVFNGFENRKELEYYYPTSVLVTGWDIIFLWVARMAMAGFEWEGKKPFNEVYFTGMVRDKKRRKMSKSLGNSPDALELIKTYGADGVRFGMLSCSPAGGDLLFDEKLPEQGRNFCNKMWNALSLIKMWEPVNEGISEDQKAIDQLAIQWLDHRKSQILAKIDSDFRQYRLSESLMELYSFVWNDFCSWYLEMIKPAYGSNAVARATYERTLSFFEDICRMLHPFMPFITEEIWHQLKKRETGDDCTTQMYPTPKKFDQQVLETFDQLKDMITKIRDARNKNQIKNSESIPLGMDDTEVAVQLLKIPGFEQTLIKRGNLSGVSLLNKAPSNSLSFISGTEKIYLLVEQQIDVATETKKLQEELDYAIGFVNSVQKKLSNERFVNHAPEAVVEKERKKLADGKERVKILRRSLESIGK